MQEKQIFDEFRKVAGPPFSFLSILLNSSRKVITEDGNNNRWIYLRALSILMMTIIRLGKIIKASWQRFKRLGTHLTTCGREQVRVFLIEFAVTLLLRRKSLAVSLNFY